MDLSTVRRSLFIATFFTYHTRSMMTTTVVARSLASILPAQKKLEGGGFPVRRPNFPGSHVNGLILLFDHMGPMTLAPGENFPGPEHPHRGFITISYHLQGHLEHYCSSGVTGIMSPGCAQWMVAGRGVVHGGSTPEYFRKTGGNVEAFQIWINLKKKYKMAQPKYQDIMANQLPVVQLPSLSEASSSSSISSSLGTVKLVAGTFQNMTGPVETLSPVSFFDIRLQPDGKVDVPVPQGQVGVIYVYRGEAIINKDASVLQESTAGILNKEGNVLTIRTKSESPLIDIPAPHIPNETNATTEQAACGIILVFGEPIDEPIYRYGPFVMNTEEEIHQALQDYRSGKIERESRMTAEELAKIDKEL